MLTRAGGPGSLLRAVLAVINTMGLLSRNTQRSITGRTARD